MDPSIMNSQSAIPMIPKDDSAHASTAYSDQPKPLNIDNRPPAYVKVGKLVSSQEPTHFSLPVDSEHKAKVVNLFSIAFPHMRCFHMNWIAFFITFMSAYAAAPLIPIIRDDLNLVQFSANIAGVVTTAGTVFARVLMGQACDKYGPRWSYAVLLCLVSIPIFNMANVEGAAGYITLRFLIGLGLAGFVTCQFWTSMMFSPNVVGIANAVAGGWGNAGGGITQIVMPNLATRIEKTKPMYQAWRYAFWLPAFLNVAIAVVIVLFGQDLPDGNYDMLERVGKKQKANIKREFFLALTNYRVWGLAACYAYSFGVELALDNALAPYFGTNFNWGTEKAGNIAAIFGTLNFIARPLGGVASDFCGRRFGMRGRLWVLFTVLILGGLFTSLLGVLNHSITGTIIMLVLAGSFLEATCGAVYGVVPFVSRRSTGLVCGIVSAGGAIGGVMNQAIFFLNTRNHGSFYITPVRGLEWMGCVTIFVALFGIAPIYFPMWGGLVMGPRKGVTEEDYYYAEYTEEEKKLNLHLAASKFAYESRSMRGLKALAASAAAQNDMKVGNGKEVPHTTA